MHPVVSVLLPVYNGAETLAATIESILAQTLQDFELLVIDDNSSDDSAGILAHYASQDNRIKLIRRKENFGLSSALNLGLREAKSDFVARIDQDDLCLPMRLEKQHSYLTANPDVSILGSFVYHMGRLKVYDRLVKLPMTHELISRVLDNENCLYHPSVMYRRAAILDLGGYSEDFKNAEDYDLWLRAAKKLKIENFPEPLIRYRFVTSGMTLKNKWQQLYFVFLAQERNRNPLLPLLEQSAKAKFRLSQINKNDFLTGVYINTFRECLILRDVASAFGVANLLFKVTGILNGLKTIILSFWRRG